MTPAEKLAFAREWLAKGVCPGCGAALVDVAGEGEVHYLPGQTVTRHTHAYPVTTATGEVIRSGGINRNDRRLCPWTADQLAALVHIGAGIVTVH